MTALTLLCGLLLASPQDPALKDRITALVARLAGPDAGDRAAAEKTLSALEPRALELIPVEPPAGADTDAKERLARVRSTLESAAESQALQARRVTIQGQGLRLTEVLRELQRQSGNRITDLREASGAEATNPTLDLDLNDVPFFQALDVVAKQADLALNCFTENGSIGLMPPDALMPTEPGAPPVPRGQPLLQYPGPLRVEFKRIATSRELATSLGRTSLQFELVWEPRLRPMLLALKAEGIQVRDDAGRAVPPDVQGESLSVMLRPESPIIELNLNVEAPDRSARRLKSVQIDGAMTIPAGLRQFQFARLDQPNQAQKQGELGVTLIGSEVDENQWKFQLKLELPGNGGNFESYQQGMFNNRLWLQKADGSRFEHNGGFSTYGAGGQALGFEYIFVDVPGKLSDYRLVYETPSRVVTLPVTFTFTDIPLP